MMLDAMIELNWLGLLYGREIRWNGTVEWDDDDCDDLAVEVEGDE